ncbi:hypothetical protein DQ384_09905 [Sphaerisporangium album]|uniref:LppX_LprAFG lipoprotein n=1 Tax=Sphaerisporangium album TaxID=509200 RepID=A0A367FNJ2_9ACTN|nr:hypothetical protein DQ384_09905 [Sphaerisporangium album]
MTVLVATALAVLLAPAPAEAAPKDPLSALKKLVAAGRGVSFTEAAGAGESGKPSFTRKGVLRFGKGGIAASDLTSKQIWKESDESSTWNEPERTIRIGTTSYTRGHLIGQQLPPGKTWWKQSPGWTSGVSAMFGNYLNVAEPATLKALLADAERSGSTYEGEISLKKLLKVSPWTRATVWWKVNDKAKVGWRLVVTSSGLPRRLTTYAMGLDGPKEAEVRFTGWGAKVTVKAPPRGAVTTKLVGVDRPPLPPAPKR